MSAAFSDRALPLAGMRCGLYVRISDDQAGDAAGVGRQEADGRAYLDRRGGELVRIFRENDTSAYKKRRLRKLDASGNEFYVYRVIRPIYQELLSELRAGRLDAAVVYDIDRLARDPRDLEDAIEIVQHSGRRIESVTGGIDLMTDAGIAMARVLVAMANKASADTARRVKRKHRENAESGIPVGGTRPFGYHEDKRSLDQREAAAIQDAAARLIRGETCSSVLQRWNSEGLLTPRGNKWILFTFKQTLRNPRLSGYRSRKLAQRDGGRTVYVYEIVRSADGAEVLGQWEAILTRDAWEAVIRVLNAQPRPAGGENSIKYLLSGIARCGKCGSGMRGVRPTRNAKTGVPAGGPENFYYQCPGKHQGGCGGVGRSGPKVDEFITSAVLAKAERETALRTVEVPLPTWGRAEELARVERKLAEAFTAWKAEVVDGPDYFAMRADLEKDRQALNADRNVWQAGQVNARHDGIDLRAEWPRYTVRERRAAIGRVLLAVEIKPLPTDPLTGKLMKRWNPDLLVPVWRQ